MTMTKEQLAAVLAEHKKWLIGEGGKRANLSYADLTDANLTDANLSGADLTEPVCRMDFGGWSICIRAAETKIGCQSHANADWLRWLPSDVAHMDSRASAWWETHGDAVKAAIRCVMAKAAEQKKEVMQ
jgi:hypothetical protein